MPPKPSALIAIDQTTASETPSITMPARMAAAQQSVSTSRFSMAGIPPPFRPHLRATGKTGRKKCRHLPPLVAPATASISSAFGVNQRVEPCYCRGSVDAPFIEHLDPFVGHRLHHLPPGFHLVR